MPKQSNSFFQNSTMKISNCDINLAAHSFLKDYSINSFNFYFLLKKIWVQPTQLVGDTCQYIYIFKKFIYFMWLESG